MRLTLLALVAGLALAGPASAAAPPSLEGRPAKMMALDAGRQPGAVLAASGIEAGDTVLDVMAGEGYYSELIARMVGPTGRVIALEPTIYMERGPVVEAWTALRRRQPNVTLVTGPPADTAWPGNLDVAFFHTTYHDLYFTSEKAKYPHTDVPAFNRRLFAAMKKGGRVVIVDHVGVAGMDSRVQADKTHRIDPAVVRADMTAAGFVLDADLPLLRTAGDDMTKSVFDPALRGKTDRFFYIFRKP